MKRIIVLASLSVALAAGLATMLFRPGGQAPAQATVLSTPIDLPEFTLQDPIGNSVSRPFFAGQWSFVFFGFTQCPDICPLTLQQLASARRQLAEDRPADDLPAIVFVSVDPERDTAEAVGAYASAFGGGVVGLRGDLAEIDKLTRTLGVFHARPANADGGYDVEHSAAILVVNDRAQFHAVFSAPHTTATLASDMAVIMDAR